MKIFGFPRIAFAPETGGGSVAPSAPATPSTAPSSGSLTTTASSPASGTTASPSSAPSGAPSASPASAGTSDGPTPDSPLSAAPAGEDPFDFSSIFTTDGDTPSSAAKPVEAAAPPAPKAAEPPKPPAGAEPPKPAEAAPAAAEKSPAAPSPQAPAASASETPHIDPSDPVSVAKALGENEAAAIEHVAKTMFALSPEDVEALESDTVGTIPKLLARSFVRAQRSMLEQLGRMVPQMIQRHQEVVKRNTENEGKFFGRWPDLKPDLHGDLVRKYGATYRAMHPTATLDQMIEDLGPMVMMAAKVVPTMKPAVPSATAPANGARPPQPSPFVPALGGPGAASTEPSMEPFEAILTHQEE